MQKSARLLTIVLALSLILLSANNLFAQYKRVNLVSNMPGAALHVDPNLINGWGLAFFAHSPFWVADAGTGVSTLYGPGGSMVPLVVTVPSAPGLGPTGIVANSSAGFVVTENGVSGPAAFIFDSMDGTISGWSPNVDVTHAIIAVNNSSSGAAYTGLAIAMDSSGNTFIYAADQGNNKVDIYDSGFNFVKSFTDSSLPAGFSAFGIQNIGGKLYVTFAGFFSGNLGGFVDVFDTSGNLIKKFAANGTLNLPWGLAQAPADFGRFSHDILIGNLFDGTINAFRRNGKFKGQLKDAHGKVISVDGLWALKFGTDPSANGGKNQLFFTAGPSFYANGLFGRITAIEDDQGEDEDN